MGTSATIFSLRYFVISPDGSKFGPAEIALLRQWVSEGRILPDTMLEEERSHQRVPAKMVAGLFGTELVQAAPHAYTRNPKTEYTRGGNSNWDVALSYICSVMSILCCGFFIIGGFTYANRAIAKGNNGGYIARWVAVFFLLLWIVTTIIEIKFFGDLMEYFKPKLGIE